MMKISYLFIALLAVAFSSHAQEIPCGTEISAEYAESMRASMPEFEIYKEIFDRHMSESGSRSFASKKNSIPIRVHIVRQTSGITALDTSLITKGINYMNKKMAGAGLEFYICGAYNYINNTTYYTLDNTEYDLLNNTYGTANVINLFMVNGISHYGSSAVGVAPTPNSDPTKSLWVMMRNNADSNTYAHEMGHFFGLLHTHGYSNTVRTDEYVDGSNCRDAGDYFCDTPADPRLSPAIIAGANVNSSCVYFGGLKDDHYQTYVPDATNIMSYAPGRCMSRFSNEQLAYMNWTYLTRRSNLTCSSINVNFNSNTIFSCDSPFVYNFTNESSGVSSYQWDINDDDVTDYTTTNPSHTYTSAGIKWVSLSGTSGGRTYMRYKPIEFVRPHKVPHLMDFNSGVTLANGWTLINLDNGRKWEFINIKGSNGQYSNALRFRNFDYVGYEEVDAIVSNSYDLRGFRNARLSFDVAYAPHSVTDTLLVYISTNCGVSYPYQVLKLFGSTLQTHNKQFQEYVPAENEWKNISVSLNAYVNNFVKVKIVNFNKGGNDVYIDNIRIDGSDSTLNEIGFGRIELSTSENSSTASTDCSAYKIISVPVYISTAPTANITVNVSATGTAINLYDYELVNNQVIFPSGSTAFQYVNIKIYDDQASELNELLKLSLSVASSTIYSTPSKNKSINITINDNDPANPEQKTFSKVLMDENFNTISPSTYLPIGWTVAGQFAGTDGLGFWFYDPDLATFNNSIDSTDYMLFWGDAGSIHAPETFYMETPNINTVDYDSIKIELDQWLKAYLPYTGDVGLDVWNGTSWVNKYTHPGLQGNIGKVYKPDHLNITIAGYNNADFKVRIGLVNERNSYWYAVDNLKITGIKVKARVASNLNANTTAYLGPNELVHFYDDTTGNIIASIQNLSNWNYGCTNIFIDRSGDSVIKYMNNSAIYHATQKTVLITPTNNNASGSYDISLYYKSNEMNNWLFYTNNLLSEINLVKSGSHIYNISPSNTNANGPTNYNASSPSTIAYIGTERKITGHFDEGFSGFAAAKSFANPLPVSMLVPLNAKNKKNEGNLIDWTTASELNCEYFDLQRSIDGIHFYKISQLQGQGNSTQPHYYSYIDNDFATGYNYYRFIQYDYDKKHSYSNIDVVDNSAQANDVVTIYPNPCSDYLHVELYNFIDKTYTIKDNRGAIVCSGMLNGSDINIQRLAAGFYTITIMNAENQLINTSKIFKN